MKLIITADDFGRSTHINAAVIQAHRQGILTAASLMVAGDAFDEAVELARQTPTLAVGLHVVLVDGKPVLPPERLRGLVDENGRFPDSPARLGMQYFFNPRARRQVAEEIAAQFERFAQTGLPLAHVDGHQHLHLHPAVFPMVARLAGQYGAGGIRLPRDELRLALHYNSAQALTKLSWSIVFGLLSRWSLRALRELNLPVARRVYGLMQTGQMEERYVIELLRHIQADSAEIYFHPTTGPRTDALGPNPDELATLLIPSVRQAVADGGFRLSSYRDLPKGRQ